LPQPVHLLFFTLEAHVDKQTDEHDPQ